MPKKADFLFFVLGFFLFKNVLGIKCCESYPQSNLISFKTAVFPMLCLSYYSTGIVCGFITNGIKSYQYRECIYTDRCALRTSEVQAANVASVLAHRLLYPTIRSKGYRYRWYIYTDRQHRKCKRQISPVYQHRLMYAANIGSASCPMY